MVAKKGLWQRILIRMSVQSRLWAGLVLLILVIVSVVSTALKLPHTGWTFSLDAEPQLLATQAGNEPQRGLKST